MSEVSIWSKKQFLHDDMRKDKVISHSHEMKERNYIGNLGYVRETLRQRSTSWEVF